MLIDLYLLVSVLTVSLQFPQAYLSRGIDGLCSNDRYVAYLQIYAHIFTDILADDILHARIQTMGVAEHIFDVTIHGKAVTWHLYDVGGARGQRHSWVPYFDDANAIIFVAPVSAFDQVPPLIDSGGSPF